MCPPATAMQEPRSAAALGPRALTQAASLLDQLCATTLEVLCSNLQRNEVLVRPWVPLHMQAHGGVMQGAGSLLPSACHQRTAASYGHRQKAACCSPLMAYGWTSGLTFPSSWFGLCLAASRPNSQTAPDPARHNPSFPARPAFTPHATRGAEPPAHPRLARLLPLFVVLARDLDPLARLRLVHLYPLLLLLQLRSRHGPRSTSAHGRAANRPSWAPATTLKPGQLVQQTAL